jgi:hypothetical protein
MTATNICSAILSGEFSKMSKLDAVMDKHMNNIVFEEHRPFSYRDFLSFKIDGKEYGMEWGTFRNKVSLLKKADKVELEYRSGLAFYTIKGVNFGKRKSNAVMETMMTSDHMEVSHCHCHCHHDNHAKENIAVHDTSNAPIYDIIVNLPLDKNSLHDIHMRFEVPNIWTILSCSSISTDSQEHQQQQQQLQVNPISKDIALPTWTIDDLNIKTTVHRTDTVSVVVGCSYAPIALDINGVIRLSNALTRVEERLSRLVSDCSKVISNEYESLSIPEHSQWIVTIWHFGADASIEYAGEKFSATYEIGENVLVRAYSKGLEDGKARIRLERQEYPKKTLADAIEEKLNLNAWGGF